MIHYFLVTITNLLRSALVYLGFSLIALLCFLLSNTVLANNSHYYVNKLKQTPSASLLVQDSFGRTLHSHNTHTGLVPASTIKILTAYIALQHWGLTHRFHTDVLLDTNNVVWVKGYGDPYLVSEELQLMASQVARHLRARGRSSISNLRADDSYFNSHASQLQIPRSLNPYDAPLGSLSANFNSLGYIKSGGNINPIEWQTPLTPLAFELSDLTGNGKHRISLRNGSQASRYFLELFSVMLEREGIHIENKAVTSKPRSIPILYRHYNSRTLSEVVQNMLKYSNNFIANQLFLALGVAKQHSQAASMRLSQHYVNTFIKQRFKWDNYFIDDGAGLSRQNSLSSRQMVELLEAFKPFYYLLPCINQGHICAKTGTLSDVHSYAGYFINGQTLYPFAIFFQKRMPYRFRKKMAKALFNDLFNNYNDAYY